MNGIVIKSTGNWYAVMAEGGAKINCRIKGRLRMDGFKSTNPVAVGDRVIFEREEDGTGIIKEVGERKNCIIRKSKKLSKQTHILAANIDQAILVVTLAIPKTSFGFIDRFLATAEAYRIPGVLIFNKEDFFRGDALLDKELEETINVYSKTGYPCFSVCATKMNEEAKEKVKKLLQNKTSLLAGHSGVGKSTLINAIEPTLNLKTGEISEAHMKGTHTTTFTEMFPLSFGGLIIDSPGIKEFSLINMEKNEVYHFFPEIFKKSAECKYPGCLHINEPKCAVAEAVERGEIAVSRYHSYLSILGGEEVVKEYDD